MSRGSRAAFAALAGVLGCWAAAPAARAQAIQRGFELERAGRTADAAEWYLAAVRAQPANSAALLGLERVLPRLGRLPDLLPLAQRAVAQEPRNDALLGLLLRTYVALERSDSAEALALRWAASDGRDDQAYREWAIALQDGGRLPDARRVLLLGRRALGRPQALAVELAEVAERSGAWEEAGREWANAVTATPSLVPAAAERLKDIPEERRTAVLGVLTGGAAEPPAQRVGAELLLSWGDPARAWTVLERSLATPTPEGVQGLRRFADLAGALGTPAGRRARGLALTRLADLVPPALASRARADAARALLDAGDHAGARRVLEALADDPTAPPAVLALAQAALIRALIEGGQLDAAGRRLDSLADVLAGEDGVELRMDLARARLARGELDQAERALAGDSSVEAAAMRGWAALYRGDAGAAAKLFRDAGPYAGRAGEATDRTQMLALLQRLGAVRSEELGAAMLLLARGDSAGALAAITRVAGRRELAAGRPDLLLLAGQVAARLGGSHDATAVALFAEVVGAGGEGAAPPAAELEWARVLLRQGKAADAIAHLEHLILTYPGSAVVPQARRELERARGAIPRS